MQFTSYKNWGLLLLLICSLSTAFAQLNEGFEGITFPPAGWAAFDNGVCQIQSWKQVKAIPNPKANSGDGYAFVKFSSVSNEACEDWLVTPLLDVDANNNSLSFYATDDFEQDFGSLYTVRVSTESQSDPSTFEDNILATYTEEDFINDIYQQFTVDLSAYIGQQIYIAFVLENSRGDSFFLDDVTGPNKAPLVTVPNCDAVLNTPSSGAIEVSVNTSLAWSPASENPTGYKLRIGTTLGGSDILDFPDTLLAGTTYTPLTPLAYATTHYVTILPTNSVGDASLAGCTDFSFTTEADPNIILDCAGAATPVQGFLCYGAGETEAFTISSNNGDQVEITFTSGTVENNQDELFVYDGTDDTGILLNEGELYGSEGDLAGLSYISSTGSLFILLTPDQSNDCQDGQQSFIEFTASCASCTPATAAFVGTTCDVQNDQFSIELDVTGLGSGTVDISNDQNANVQTISALGMITVGPFDFGEVILTLENPSDPTCDVDIIPVLVESCPPANDSCINAIPLTVSSGLSCNNQLSGTLLAATENIAADLGICPGGEADVWYSFTPSNTDQYVFELTDTTDFIDLALYSGDCTNGLVPLEGNCFPNDLATVALTQNVTYYVQVFGGSDSLFFDLCVYPLPPAPSNDLCAGATVLSCPTGNTLLGENATYATNTDAAACNGTTIDKGLWYQIAGTGDYITLSIDPVEWNPAIQIWSGADCNNLSCDTTVNNGTFNATETIADFETTAGVNYYIYVGAADDLDNPGVFDLTLSCAEFLEANIICLDDPVQEPCDSILIDNGTVSGLIEACEAISTTESEVLVLPSTSLVLTAGISITLKAGFHARAGSSFHAFIANCPQNIKGEDETENRSQQPKAATGANLQLKVHPNPAQEVWNVQIYTEQSSLVQLSISDLSGKTVKVLTEQQLLSGWNQLPVHGAGLSNGIYFLNLITPEKSITEKIVLSQ